MIEDVPESGDGLFYSRAAAEKAAQHLRAEGRETRIEESLMHPGQWVVHATPKPEDKSAPVEVGVVEEPIASAPADLDISNSTDLQLQTYRSQTEAEAAARILQAAGRATKILPSQLHPRRYVVYSIKQPQG